MTQAIQTGQWVLLDSANLCNPTVLDRLNPMLEPGGQLYLNECGTVNGLPRVIHPHPDFRLFLALDPRYCPLLLMLHNLLWHVVYAGAQHHNQSCCLSRQRLLMKLIRYAAVWVKKQKKQNNSHQLVCSLAVCIRFGMLWHGDLLKGML